MLPSTKARFSASHRRVVDAMRRLANGRPTFVGRLIGSADDVAHDGHEALVHVMFLHPVPMCAVPFSTAGTEHRTAQPRPPDLSPPLWTKGPNAHAMWTTTRLAAARAASTVRSGGRCPGSRASRGVGPAPPGPGRRAGSVATSAIAVRSRLPTSSPRRRAPTRASTRASHAPSQPSTSPPTNSSVGSGNGPIFGVSISGSLSQPTTPSTTSQTSPTTAARPRTQLQPAHQPPPHRRVGPQRRGDDDAVEALVETVVGRRCGVRHGLGPEHGKSVRRPLGEREGGQLDRRPRPMPRAAGIEDRPTISRTSSGSTCSSTWRAPGPAAAGATGRDAALRPHRVNDHPVRPSASRR